MPIHNYLCPQCSDLFEVITGTIETSKNCPQCDIKGSRQFSSTLADGIYTQSLDEETTKMLIENKQCIEEDIKAGKVGSLKERGPRAFRPEVEKKFY